MRTVFGLKHANLLRRYYVRDALLSLIRGMGSLRPVELSRAVNKNVLNERISIKAEGAA